MSTQSHKRGRPRMDEPSGERFTPKEIHSMWRNFKGSPDEITLLMDLAVLDRNAAIKLSQAYWQQYEAEQRKRHQTPQNAP